MFNWGSRNHHPASPESMVASGAGGAVWVGRRLEWGGVYSEGEESREGRSLKRGTSLCVGVQSLIFCVGVTKENMSATFGSPETDSANRQDLDGKEGIRVISQADPHPFRDYMATGSAGA